MTQKTLTHFVGIKGTGMSALACLLHDRGTQVTGSDIESYVFTQGSLESRGIMVFPFGRADVRSASEVVYSAAFENNHPEVNEAKQLGISTYSYPKYLGKLSRQQGTICITGTHGKTTTSGMLVEIWKSAGRSPSYIIGDGRGGAGDSDFILEACEYRRHFLEYAPRDTLILNIEFDHRDYFRDMTDTIDAFSSLASATEELIVACGDDPHVRQAVAEANYQAETPVAQPRVVYYGFGPDNEYRAKILSQGPEGQRYLVIHQGEVLGEVSLAVPGTHNVLNSLGAAALSLERGITLEQVKAGLAAFRGSRRRFEVTQVGSGVLVDDYAHHPTEIAATIQSARERFPGRHVVAAFQPHTFTRTKVFLNEFAKALGQADTVWVLDIFGSARERAGEVSSADLVQMVGDRARVINFDALVGEGKKSLAQGAALLLMGAGDIYKAKADLIGSPNGPS